MSLLALRPADAAETSVAWKMAMENTQSPTALILSRQNINDLPGKDRYEEALQACKGAYIVTKNGAHPDIILLASGSEVSTQMCIRDSYYAVYLDIPQWMEGSFQFRLFGNAEIYLDGQKKLTYTENQPANRSLSCELLPGKHSLIIKTVTKGGKVLACRFDNQTKSEGGSLAFTLSPKRGKNIYDILNGNHISKAELSPSGKYAIVSIRESLDGKNKEKTHIYRVKDKEIVYSLFADLLHPQWVPQQDKLSWLQAEGKGKSFYTYDIETQQLQCLIKEDLFINNYNCCLLYTSSRPPIRSG